MPRLTTGTTSISNGSIGSFFSSDTMLSKSAPRSIRAASVMSPAIPEKQSRYNVFPMLRLCLPYKLLDRCGVITGPEAVVDIDDRHARGA